MATKESVALLLTAMNAEEESRASIGEILEGAKRSFRKGPRKRMVLDTFQSHATDISMAWVKFMGEFFEKRLTEEECLALEAFYSSPAYAKLRALQQDLLADQQADFLEEQLATLVQEVVNKQASSQLQ